MVILVTFIKDATYILILCIIYIHLYSGVLTGESTGTGPTSRTKKRKSVLFSTSTKYSDNKMKTAVVFLALFAVALGKLKCSSSNYFTLAL